MVGCIIDYDVMAADSFPKSRLSALPEQAASTKKQSPSSLRPPISGRSSFSEPQQTAAMPGVSCQKCPHCHQKISDTGWSSSSEDHSSEDVPPKLTMCEALTSIPCTHSKEKAQPTRMWHITKRKASNPSVRGMSLLSVTKRSPKAAFWSRIFSRAPERPTRPPIEQCPPKQKCFADHGQFDQHRMHVQHKQEVFEPSCNSCCLQRGRLKGTISGLNNLSHADTHCFPSYNPHHDLAYSLLTGSDASLDHKPELANRGRYPSMVVEGVDTESHSNGEAVPSKQAPGIWYSQSHSSSSLPTTASKVALKPSPLRLIKEYNIYNEASPIPLKSQYKDVSLNNRHAIENSEGLTNCGGNALVSTRTRSSSYTTASIYSSDEEEATTVQNGTSPSPPPLFPARSSSGSQSVSKNVKDHADVIRDELGITKDVNMYTDTNAVSKGQHEAFTDGIRNEVAHLSEVGQATPWISLRTQKQPRRERARSEAKQCLTGATPNLAAQDANFEQWLNCIAPHDTRKNKFDSRLPTFQIQSHRPISQPKAKSQRHGYPLSEIPEDAEHRISAALEAHDDSEAPAQIEPDNMHTTYSPVSHLNTPNAECVSENNRLKSTINLKSLRKQLLALMEDDAEHSRQKDNSEAVRTTRKSSSAASSQSSVSTVTTEEIPSNLQKIVIEWKGKRYPVLIGERGKIWEGPCTREGCKKHAI